MAWLNPDGLYLKYGTEKATATKAGHYKTFGELREVELTLSDLTTLGASSAIVNDVTMLPAGARIEEVEVVCETVATSSGSAALNIGLIREDRTTALDADGLVAALALTSIDGAGEKTVLRLGSTSAGALIGTTLAYAGLLVADYDTAAYTAGAVRIRIRYYKP